MSAPSISSSIHHDPAAVAATKKRNRMLCQRCRHDKQGCHPPDRDWDRRDKCDRCAERGYDCSAPEKAPFKQRKKRAATGTHGGHTTPRSATSSDAHLNLRLTDMAVLTTTASDLSPEKSSARPLLAWDSELESISAAYVAPSVIQPDLESTSVSARKSNEQEARIILAKLGDLNATREMLRSDLKLCDKVQVWLGDSTHVVPRIRAAIKAAITAIHSEFSLRLVEANPFVTTTRDIGPFKEAFVSQLRFIKYKFRNPPKSVDPAVIEDDAHLAMDEVDDDDVQEKLYELHKRKKVWSAADYLLGNASSRMSSRHPVYTHSENDVVFCYIKASEGIKEVFSDIVLEEADHRKVLSMEFTPSKGFISAFPPCHLAVSQANASILLALWKKSAMPIWDVDYLHRTPVHCATYVGKVQGLQSIFQANPATAANTGYDAFGLTPLAIAACKDDVKTFIRLDQAGNGIFQDIRPDIVDDAGIPMSILGLAARNGSINVVKYVVGHYQPWAFQRGTSELCQALSSNQVCIAHTLVEWHCKQSYYDLSAQIPAAIQIAQTKGFHQILARLEALAPSRDDALQSLDDAEFSAFTNSSSWDTTVAFESPQHINSQDYEFQASLLCSPFDVQNHTFPTETAATEPYLAGPSKGVSRKLRHSNLTRVRPP